MNSPIPLGLTLFLLAQCSPLEIGDRADSSGLVSPHTFAVVQRQEKVLSQLPGKPRIRIGDITAGQVLVEIIKGETPLLDTVSMRPGDFHSFKTAGLTRYLQMRALENFLIGDDYAVFLLTATAPEVDQRGKADLPVRNRKWALPIAIAGVPNLHKVGKGIYRSGQPTEEGFKNLERLGIKTVINLRTFHSDLGLMKGGDFTARTIPMLAWRPKQEQVRKFLDIVISQDQHPILVHCMHGADRTGLMCAVYRIGQQGWTKAEAIKEMTKGGFGFHGIWKAIITGFIKKLDVKEISNQVIEASAKKS